MNDMSVTRMRRQTVNNEMWRQVYPTPPWERILNIQFIIKGFDIWRHPALSTDNLSIQEQKGNLTLRKICGKRRYCQE